MPTRSSAAARARPSSARAARSRWRRSLPLLGDKDRWVRYAARIADRARRPAGTGTLLLADDAKRPQLEAMLALVRAGKLG